MIKQAGQPGPEKEGMQKSKKASQHRVSDYIKKSFSLALKAVMWAGVCVALNIGLLYFSQLLFGFYMKSPMGPEFSAANPELMDTIAQLTDMGFEQLSITLTMTAFITCLVILVSCKLFFLARYITPMGIVGRAITFILPFSAVVAMLIPESVPVGGWGVAFSLSVFPTLMLFNISLTIADELFLEVDDVIALFQKKDDPGKRFNDRR